MKKGTALTIPYSGEPERPRRSNYPFIGGLVDPKTLVLASVKDQRISLNYIIYILRKKSTKKLVSYGKMEQQENKMGIYNDAFYKLKIQLELERLISAFT